MNDPRLQSVHLEAAPRREDFRRARARVESALGEHTLAGEIRLRQPDGPPDGTWVPGNRASTSTCWLLDAGRQIPLKVGLNSVGRLPDNDVVLDDATVSRRHCAIVVHSDCSVELHDVASKNGTTINGRKLNGATRLTDGDEIILCEHRVVFLVKSGNATVDRASHQPKKFGDDATMIG